MTKRFTLSFAAVLAGLMLTGCSLRPSRIALPLDNDIIQLGVGVKILPKADAFTCMRISPLWLGEDYVALANLSAVSVSDTHNGLAVGGILSAAGGCGLSAALLDHNGRHSGIRIGGVVCGGRQNGIQIGAVTYCSAKSHALQIGLLNFTEGVPFPIPLLNLVWPSGDEKGDSVPAEPQVTEPCITPEPHPAAGA